MKTNKFLKVFGIAALMGVMLSSCQIAPINSRLTITDANGAGTKTINLLALVDGSAQMKADTSFEGNTAYYYVDDIDMKNVSYTQKDDGAKVSYVDAGLFTNPNKLTTKTAVWEEWNAYIKTLIPEGFTFTISTIQSSGWDDTMMDNVTADPTFNQFKAYVYTLTYSFNNLDEYISKTKTLIGDTSYKVSQLNDIEKAGSKWATLAKGEKDVYTFSEAWYVNYWSVYGITDVADHSKYFNLAAYGAGYELTTDNLFSVSQNAYKIGEGDEVKVKVDNKSGTDSSELGVKFVTATGTIPSKANTGLIVGLCVGGAAIIAAGVVIGVIVSKKKKKAA